MQALAAKLQEFFKSKAAYQALKKDFCYIYCVEHSLNDFVCSLTHLDLLHNYLESIKSQFSGSHIFLMPSENAAICAPYVLYSLAYMESRVSIKIPKRNSFLRLFCDFLYEKLKLNYSFTDKKLDDSKRFDKIFCFGSDQTLNYLKQARKETLYAHGSLSKIGILENRHKDSLNFLCSNIIKDAFGTKQLGCLALRALFIHKSIDLFSIQKNLQRLVKKEFSRPLRKEDRFAIYVECDNLQQKSFQITWDGHRALFPSTTLENLTKNNIEPLANQAFVLPLISYSNHASLEMFLKPTIPKNDRLVSFGSSNISLWNGKLHGKELFKKH